jgi:hypothetical protein
MIDLNRNDDKNFDKIKNLDSDYFDNKANKLQKSNIIKDRIIEEKNEYVSLKNSVNINQNKGINANISLKKLETNENQNQGSSIVMKRIVLLEPEHKIKKDDNSHKSLDMSNDSNLL